MITDGCSRERKKRHFLFQLARKRNKDQTNTVTFHNSKVQNLEISLRSRNVWQKTLSYWISRYAFNTNLEIIPHIQIGHHQVIEKGYTKYKFPQPTKKKQPIQCECQFWIPDKGKNVEKKSINFKFDLFMDNRLFCSYAVPRRRTTNSLGLGGKITVYWIERVSINTFDYHPRNYLCKVHGKKSSAILCSVLVQLRAKFKEQQKVKKLTVKESRKEK